MFNKIKFSIMNVFFFGCMLFTALSADTYKIIPNPFAEQGLQYITSGNFVSKTGDTMTGNLTAPNLIATYGINTSKFNSSDIIISTGAIATGSTLSTSGAGTKMFWYPRKVAFRAGYVNGTQWDDGNIGNYSVSMGFNNTSSGLFSTTFGGANSASANYAGVFGGNSGTASSFNAFVGGGAGNSATNEGSAVIGGYVNTASGLYSTVVGGANNNSSGSHSFATGSANTSGGNYSFTGGLSNTASGQYGVALGWGNTASARGATTLGYTNIVSQEFSTAIGNENVASGYYAIAMGNLARAVGNQSFAINLDYNTVGPDVPAWNFRVTGATAIGGNVAWTNYSDKRLKTNIKKIEGEDNLSKILALEGIRFNWKKNKGPQDILNLGFIAQEVKSIIPEAVRYDELNDIYSMESAAVIPVLVEAIKEQQKQIENLKKEIKRIKENCRNV